MEDIVYDDDGSTSSDGSEDLEEFRQDLRRNASTRGGNLQDDSDETEGEEDASEESEDDEETDSNDEVKVANENRSRQMVEKAKALGDALDLVGNDGGTDSDDSEEEEESEHDEEELPQQKSPVDVGKRRKIESKKEDPPKKRLKVDKGKAGGSVDESTRVRMTKDWCLKIRIKKLKCL